MKIITWFRRLMNTPLGGSSQPAKLGPEESVLILPQWQVDDGEADEHSEGDQNSAGSGIRVGKDGVGTWVFAEPLEAIESKWDFATFVPPKTLIAEADKAMRANGVLQIRFGESYPVEKVAKMTPEETTVFIRSHLGAAKYMHYYASTQLIKYHVVLFFQPR
jgi:hypothetical protein